MSEQPNGGGPTGRAVGLFALAAAGLAAASLLAAAAGEGPYLAASHVNGWVVVYAAALLGLLISFPFAVQYRLRERIPDADRRWEVALTIWGALALALGALAFLWGSSAGFDLGTLGGAVAVITCLEAVIVFGVIAIGVLSG